MADLISMLAAASGGATAESDPNFKQTVLLLHGDGTNGAQNNTFLDSSANNFTITRNGNTTQGTFSPFSGPNGYWSNYFDGTDDYLSVADNAVLRPGAGAFTLEAWIYRNASGAAHTIYAKGGASTGIVFQVTSGNVLRFTHTTTNIDSTGTIAANTWTHVAVVREGTGTNQTKLYINGTNDGQGTVSTDFTQTEEVRIGTNRGATEDFAGYISNVRFVKGSALYTTTFTPSTVPLTTTSQGASSSEVELLTCQSNRFVDNSSNAFAITRNGDVRVTPFSPFAPTAAYSAGTNGGSGYFDGTGDYLNFTEFSSATDFTCECWFYRGPNVSARHILFGGNRTISNARNCQLAVSNDGGIVVILNDAVVANFDNVGGNAVPRDSWNHIAYVRSSTTISVFVNGTRIATGTSSATLYVTQVGAYIDSLGASVCNGYISSARVTNTAVYDPSQTTLTVPTAPLTAISGTSLLLNFTNAGIIDNTGKNNLETVGNAQIDTAVKKYGTGSLEFDGTGDYLTTQSNVDLGLGTGDFTIECWAYFNGVSTQQNFIDARTASVGTAPILYITATGVVNYSAGGAALITSSSNAVSATTWTHIALARSSGNSKLFVNGVQFGSTATDTTNFGTTAFTLGAVYNGTNPMTGYIDDLRITKGVARYTANFTAPTKAFPDQ